MKLEIYCHLSPRSNVTNKVFVHSHSFGSPLQFDLVVNKIQFYSLNSEYK